MITAAALMGLFGFAWWFRSNVDRRPPPAEAVARSGSEHKAIRQTTPQPEAPDVAENAVEDSVEEAEPVKLSLF